jgi:hypothetical protein
MRATTPGQFRSIQEVFNHVAAHLLEQNEVCSCYGTRPDYWDTNGRSCAIGCLVPESMQQEYVTTAYRGPENDLRTLWTKLLGFECDHFTKAFLTELQRVHDLYKPADWRKKLKQLATFYDLGAAVTKA